MDDVTKNGSFLKIPANRVFALVMMDVISVLVASFGALLIRFEFSFKAIDPLYITRYERILFPGTLVTLLFYFIWKLYKSVWRYASANELINIFCCSLLFDGGTVFILFFYRQ